MLPTFRYHPDPIATGNIKPTEVSCLSCGQSRGYIYTGPVYGDAGLRDKLCPWCIASGSAALKFNCFFCDELPLRRARLDRPIILEVSRKTPGYSSWQQGVWQVCCEDACEFHGDASQSHLAELTGDALEQHLSRWKWKADYWRKFLDAYRPHGMASVYRFECRHCRQRKFALDLG